MVFLEVRTSQVGDRRINTLMDLTERQRADAALRASETQFRAMFDSSAIAISLVDLSGRPMKTNRALTQLLGFTEQELCTKSWMALSTDIVPSLGPKIFDAHAVVSRGHMRRQSLP